MTNVCLSVSRLESLSADFHQNAVYQDFRNVDWQSTGHSRHLWPTSAAFAVLYFILYFTLTD